MKIRNIEIKNFRQFKKFSIDLTYPEGHEKHGQPLNKVCFIGQSGTGKTNLLKYITQGALLGKLSELDIENISENALISFEILPDKTRPDFVLKKTCVKFSTSIHTLNPKINKEKTPLRAKYEELKRDRYYLDEETMSYINKFREKMHIFYFPATADFIYSKEYYDNINKGASHLSLNDLDTTVDININDLYLNQVLFCHSFILNEVGKGLNQLLANYKESELSARINATYKAEEDSEFNIKDYIEKWKEKNPNPIEKLFKADFFALLNDLKINYDSSGVANEDVFNSIFKVHNEDNRILFKELSSGIRHLILMMVPLLVRNPENSLIIIDEPETSLFPDIQKKFISTITNIGTDNQYFFATHSPIIAASFEPSERFYLYLDEEGSVSFSRGISPEGDDANDLLVKDFKMDSALGEKGEMMHEKFVNLRLMIEQEKNIEERKKLAHEFMKIGMEYGF